MNRRGALATTTGLFASLFALSDPIQAVDACDDAKKSKDKLDAGNGDLCPTYAAYFHGAYTTYFGGVYNLTTMQCENYTSYDGPNGLTLGCGGAGCAPRFVDLTRNVNNHSDLKKYGMKKRPVDTFEPTAAPGATITPAGDVYFRGNDPANPGMGNNLKIHAKLFDISMFPRSFDLDGASNLPPNEIVDHIGFQISDGNMPSPINLVADVSDKHCYLVPFNGFQYRITAFRRVPRP